MTAKRLSTSGLYHHHRPRALPRPPRRRLMS